MEPNLNLPSSDLVEIQEAEDGDSSQKEKFTHAVGSSIKKYYAVSLPDAERNLHDTSLVFDSITDALKVIKKHPQARFKEFKTSHDAHQFALLPFIVACGGESALNICTPSAEEKNATSFKSLTSQEMVRLRKQIDAGNETAFLDMVWSNPRYLIGNWDGPTILQEGTRYNALHVAARSKQTNLCLAILNTLQDLRFLRLLYPQDEESVLINFRKRLLDLYINMPDKSLNETPLHFACKFGAEKIVQILLSFVDCEREKPNKYGVLPIQMICDRSVDHSDDLKNQIRSMFEGVRYVPILRNLNNTEPIVGEPCSEDIMVKCISFSDNQCFDVNYVYCAFAGPLSHNKAKKLYFAWRKKNFSELYQYSAKQIKEFKNIILSDPVKGLERVGRQLAKDLSFEWVEYFKALDSWIDISSEKGLELLETHLKCCYDMKDLLSSPLNMEEKCDALIHFLEKGFINNFCKSAFEIIMTAHMKDKNTASQLFQIIIPYIRCLTSSSFSNEAELSQIHDEIGHLLYLKLNFCINNKDLHEFIMYLNTKFEAFCSKSRNWAFLICILKSVWFHHLTHISELHVFKKNECSCMWVCQESNYSASVFCSRLMNRRQEVCNKMLNEDGYILSLYNSESGVSVLHESQNSNNHLSFEESNSPQLSDEDFFTPPESPSLSDTDKLDENMHITHTPMKFSCHFDDEIYINGASEMIDDDIDLYRGIEKVLVNEQMYPYVFKWKILIESKLIAILRPETELSRTPASASTTVNRHIKERKRVVPKTLF